MVFQKMRFGWVQFDLRISLATGPKLTRLFCQMQEIDQVIVKFWKSSTVPEIFTIKVWSHLQSHKILHVFGPKFLWREGPLKFLTWIIYWYTVATNGSTVNATE